MEARPIPQGVVGSGTFHPADGSTTGTVDIVVTGEFAKLVLRDLKSTHKRLGVRAPFRHPQTGPCADGAGFAFADIVAGTPAPLILDLSLGRGDPTFIREVALTTFMPADDSTECINKVVARVPLGGPFVLRSYLDTLVDDGTRGRRARKAMGHTSGRSRL